MKKIIIVTLITGFLTVQAPIQALQHVDHGALAQAATAQSIAGQVGNKAKSIAALKSICTKTNRVRNTLVAGGLLSAAALVAAAYTYGIPVDYLMSLISTPVAAAAGAFDTCNEGMINLGTGCVETCQSGFSDVAGQCVEAICPAVVNACHSGFDACQEGISNLGTEVIQNVAQATATTAVNACHSGFDACQNGLVNLGTESAEVITPVVEPGLFNYLSGYFQNPFSTGLKDLANPVCELTENMSAAAQDIAQNVVQDVAQNVVQDVAQNVVQDVAQNVAQDVAQNVAQDVAQDVAQNVMPNVMPNIMPNVVQNLVPNVAAKANCTNCLTVLPKVVQDVATQATEKVVQNVAKQATAAAAQNSTVWNRMLSSAARFILLK